MKLIDQRLVAEPGGLGEPGDGRARGFSKQQGIWEREDLKPRQLGEIIGDKWCTLCWVKPVVMKIQMIWGEAG